MKIAGIRMAEWSAFFALGVGASILYWLRFPKLASEIVSGFGLTAPQLLTLGAMIASFVQLALKRWDVQPAWLESAAEKLSSAARRGSVYTGSLVSGLAIGPVLHGDLKSTALCMFVALYAAAMVGVVAQIRGAQRSPLLMSFYTFVLVIAPSVPSMLNLV